MPREPVAIIGMACRFPGGADSPDAFWRLMMERKDAVTPVPEDRKALWAAWGDAGPFPPYGGFLTSVDRFDPGFFNISPREARHIDPQQRLLLELAWEAFEDGGYPADRLAGGPVGVFIGVFLDEYWDLQRYGQPGSIEAHTNTGGTMSVAANRISYAFDLRGPSLSVDTACSSSLTALHLACQSLRYGECRTALAGGVNLVLSPQTSCGFAAASMLSPDGRCKAFDARADGYGRSDGAGLVLLKPLSAAVRDGDRIYAVIRGTAVNQDGHTPGMTVPSADAQTRVIRAACRQAGISPKRLFYVEAHGTGTPAGDPLEAAALGRAVSRGGLCRIGSVKTNIGHTEAAAGIAGVIKTALALYHGVLPPSIHFQAPHPDIPFDRLRLRVVTEPEPVPAAAYAGVNSFGFGGANAHAVLASPDKNAEEQRSRGAGEQGSRGAEEKGFNSSFILHPSSFILPVAAHSAEALQARAGVMAAWLESAEDALPDIAATAGRRRSHPAHRLAVVCSDIRSAAEPLRAFAAGEMPKDMAVGVRAAEAPPVVFVMTGMGPQWWGMGQTLYASEPVFKETLDRCDALFRCHAGWSLLEEMRRPASASRMQETQVAQPANLALQMALHALLVSWGIAPDMVIGHSVGEIAAAAVAGALDPEDALRISYHRSRLQQTVAGKGVMLAVGVSPDEAADALAGYEDRVSLAAVNSPVSVTLAGEPAAVDELERRFDAKGASCRRLPVDVAFHSHQMDPLKASFLAAVGSVEAKPPSVPMISTVTGAPVEGRTLHAGYWWDNIREPVRLDAACAHLPDRPGMLLVQIGPHPVLSLALMENLAHRGKSGKPLATLHRERPERETLLKALAACYAAGREVNWEGVYPGARRWASLPPYTWQRQRHWLDVRDAMERSAAPSSPLLGAFMASSVHPDTQFWETPFSLKRYPYLEDHRLNGRPVMPAAAYIEMMLEAVGEGRPVLFERIAFHTPLVLSDRETYRLQLARAGAHIRVSGRLEGKAETPGDWTTFVTGDVYAGPAAPPEDYTAGLPEQNSERIPCSAAAKERANSNHSSSLATGYLAAKPQDPIRLTVEDTLQQSCKTQYAPQAVGNLQPEHVAPGAPDAFYEAVSRRGYEYGAYFQRLSEIRQQGNAVSGRLNPPQNDKERAAAYRLHPALLDGALQALLCLLPDDGHLYVPAEIAALLWYGVPSGDAPLKVYAAMPPDRLQGDVRLMDEQGRCLLEMRGVRLYPVRSAEPRSARSVPEGDLLCGVRVGADPCVCPVGEHRGVLYAEQWQEMPDAGRTATERARHVVIIMDVQGVGEGLKGALEGNGHGCTVISPALLDSEAQARYALTPAPSPPSDVVFLCPPDEEAPGYRAGARLLHLLQGMLNNAQDPVILQGAEEGGTHHSSLIPHPSLLPRLWLVTSGAQRIVPEDRVTPWQAPVWGMGRVIALEHPELHCTLVDLPAQAGRAEGIRLYETLHTESGEAEIGIRGDQRYIRRLRSFQPETSAYAAIKSDLLSIPAYRLTVDPPGALDNLCFIPSERRPPALDEIVLRVLATGLNFRDVLTASGLLSSHTLWGGKGAEEQGSREAGEQEGFTHPSSLIPHPAVLGWECVGEVVAVGAAVAHLCPGDTVLAVAPGAFGTHVTVKAPLAVPKPPGTSVEAAATIPIAFLTAYYGLISLGRLQAGDRVLIHSAAGGVGLAAIQLAQQAGAEIFATAGSEEKRAFLASLGVQHCMDSRSLDFAETIRAATDGAGVDIVLNTLAGEGMLRSLSVLAPYGRFIELGKTDLLAHRTVDLHRFEQNISYHAVDLARLARDRPERLGELFRQVMRLFEEGRLHPLPCTLFPIQEAAEAFRFMARAKHTGKIVVRGNEAPVPLRAGERVPVVTDRGTYLITGGLGGLGRLLAEWLVAQSGRHLVLTGRRKPDGDGRAFLKRLRAGGADVRYYPTDVTDDAAMEALIAGIGKDMPPLRGVFHAAGVLDDGLLMRCSAERLERVMAPKLRGAWHLHRLTRTLDLDWFVLFSSVASTMGVPGQGAYAGANAFLDALAHYRHAQGLPALSVNWGPWAGAGMAGDPETAGRLERQGFGFIAPEEGLNILDRLLRRKAPQVCVVSFDPVGARWEPHRRLFSDTLPPDGEGRAPAFLSRAELLKLAPDRQKAFIARYFRQAIEQVVEVRADTLDLEKTWQALGVDSLMAVELKHRTERDLGVSLPVGEFQSGRRIAASIGEIAEKIRAA